MQLVSGAIGFIGLGVMGFPMAENLVKKLPLSSTLYVFDISEDLIEKLCSVGQGRAYGCESAKDVSEKSV